MAENAKRKTNPLGRLTSFGLAEPWQVALLLPSNFDDLRRPITHFAGLHLVDGDRYLFHGVLDGAMTVQKRRPARLSGYISDGRGTSINFSAFGDTRDLEEEINENARDLLLYGRIKVFNNKYYLQDIELIPRKWVGWMRPRYPGKTRVINPETVRDRVMDFLRDAIPMAADWIYEELKDFGTPEELCKLAGLPDGATVSYLLKRCHAPKTPKHAEMAHAALMRLASLGVLRLANDNKVVTHASMFTVPAKLTERLKQIPFELTDEQKVAVTEIYQDLRAPVPMRRLLSGDVGTGKTAVFGLAVASVIDGGGRVAVMLPNKSLANQVYTELTTWWPDIPATLVTDETPEEGLKDQPLLVGTTALLFRKTGEFALVVVDEQHKFSKEQRESMLSNGSHLLESTGTCIPRTMALMQYGVLKVSKLTKSHVKKDIESKLWQAEQRSKVFERINETLKKKGQVLVIYPKKETGDNDTSDLPSVGEAYKQWEKLFPGRVRVAHSGLPPEDNEKAIRDMKEGKADILVSTTVVEVGITIPNLRHVLVVHAERFGLTTLHQIRGRLARLGGWGLFDMLLPKPVGDKSITRLTAMTKTTDGFKLSEMDMCLRGFGDLGANSTRQTGADETFIFGKVIDPAIMEEMMKKMNNETGDA